MYCTNCGKEIGNANFCPECGTKNNTVNHVDVPYPNPASQNIRTTGYHKKTITQRWWFWILIVSLAFVLIIVVIPKDNKTTVETRKSSASSTAPTVVPTPEPKKKSNEPSQTKDKPVETPKEKSEDKTSDSQSQDEGKIEAQPDNTNNKEKEELSFEITDIVENIKNDSYGDRKRFSVIIEITNTGNVPLYLDDCVLDYEDDDGHLLQTYHYLSSVPDIIQPGEQGYFYTNGSSSFDDGIDFSNGCNLAVNVHVEKARGKLTRYEVIDTSLYASYGSVGCKGRIVNDTDEDASYIYVTAVYYGHDGRVLGISGTSVTDIRAHEKTSFDDSGIFMDDFSVDDVAEYVVYADDMYIQF